MSLAQRTEWPKKFVVGSVRNFRSNCEVITFPTAIEGSFAGVPAVFDQKHFVSVFAA